MFEKAFCKMCVTICGRFRPDEGAVAGYGNRIRVKSPAKWGVQIAGMIFQTRSKMGTVWMSEITRFPQEMEQFVLTEQEYYKNMN